MLLDWKKLQHSPQHASFSHCSICRKIFPEYHPPTVLAREAGFNSFQCFILCVAVPLCEIFLLFAWRGGTPSLRPRSARLRNFARDYGKPGLFYPEILPKTPCGSFSPRETCLFHGAGSPRSFASRGFAVSPEPRAGCPRPL